MIRRGGVMGTRDILVDFHSDLPISNLDKKEPSKIPVRRGERMN